MFLSEIPCGKSATVLAVGGEGAFRRRMIDMGITPGALITVRKSAPFGGPMQLHLRGYELTLRRREARSVTVEVKA